jgi:flagellar biosynthesis protein FlhG
MCESTYLEIQLPLSSSAPIAVPARRASRAGVKPRRAAPVFAVTSGKGGVGKTNVVANLAIALSHLNQRVLAIDADLGLANLDLLLGVKPTFTLAVFLPVRPALDEIILTNQDGILVMPGASGVQAITSLSAEQKTALLTELDLLTHEMDLVLVDTGSGISDAVTYYTSAAQENILVVTPEPASMTAACALVKVLLLQVSRAAFLGTCQ